MTAGSLEGQWIVVTGAARRVGRAIASHLHRRGANIAIHCHRSVVAAETLSARMNSVRPNSALVVKADLARPDECRALVQTVSDRTGQLDGLVNNASTFFETPLGSITEADWDALLGSNLKGPLFVAQAAAPGLIARKGAIVNITDIHAERPLKGYCVYSSAKAGLEMLTRCLARELAPHVRVNAVAPGAVLWPEHGHDETRRRAIVERIPLGRPGEPADVALAVEFLLASAPYVTGQTLAVDGGRSLGW